MNIGYRGYIYRLGYKVLNEGGAITEEHIIYILHSNSIFTYICQLYICVCVCVCVCVWACLCGL